MLEVKKLTVSCRLMISFTCWSSNSDMSKRFSFSIIPEAGITQIISKRDMLIANTLMGIFPIFLIICFHKKFFSYNVIFEFFTKNRNRKVSEEMQTMVGTPERL